MTLKIFQSLEFLNNRLSNIERNISRLEEKLDFSLAIQRNHLIRIKNGPDLTDEAILFSRPYNDISPQQAYDIFQDANQDFIILDVSEKNFKAKSIIIGAVAIPLEVLASEYTEITSKTTPILIISENGLRSILACELLIKKGFFNLNNISGGHEFWPGHKKSLIKEVA
jgi:rhodanese-related sulfurtransferase